MPPVSRDSNRSRAIAVTLAAALWIAAPALAQTVPIAEDRTDVVHLLQRTTFGARPEDINEAMRIGREAWLDRQLEPDRIPDAAADERLTAYPVATMSQAELYAAYPPPQVLRDRFGDPDSISPAQRREMRMMSPGRMAAELTGAKLTRAVYSERQLQEVMVDFWFNHFNVFFAKGADRWLVSDYESTAIRPHVFGRFEDMLLATARHPAMLFYLDNWQSAVPDSLNPAASDRRRMRQRLEGMSQGERQALLRRRGVSDTQIERIEQGLAAGAGRERGLNENYARELLELHTLGVDGGYTQADVIEVARAFTGWSITRPRDAMVGSSSITFRFVPEMHDPGDKTVLGTRLGGGQGMDDGLDVLHLLATHPSTARHVGGKLVALLVADEPPPDMVERAAQVFLATDGDLRAVTRSILLDPQFYDAGYRQAKIRSPFELVAATLRMAEAEVGVAPMLVQQLRAFQHMPYLSDVPTGYPELDEDWVNSGAMLQRMNFALSLATGEVRGVRLQPEAVLASAGIDDPRAAPASESVHALAVALAPGEETTRLEEIVRTDLDALEQASYRDRLRRTTGLLLGSPEFQRH